MASCASIYTSNGSGSRGKWIQLKNRYCNCHERRRAAIRISESPKNPRRLLFCCDTCKFFQWWTPDNEEWASMRDYVHDRTTEFRLRPWHIASWFIGIIVANLLVREVVVMYFWWYSRRT